MSQLETEELKEFPILTTLRLDKDDQGTRQKMKDYWIMHCADNPTNDTMMLMNDASDIDQAERKEIISLLPKYTHKEVLELGCGIGRFTKTLAVHASKVIAVDFMQVCIDKNKETVGQIYKNVQYVCKDVTDLLMENQRFYFVFSNWLMMYLDDTETQNLAQKMFDWTKPGGYIFFRESCQGGASGDKPRTVNPTFYRKHLFYTTLFSQWDDLELIKICRVKCYEEMKNKTNQYIWLFRKKMTTATIENESSDN